MTLYAGPPLLCQDVALTAANIEATRAALGQSDLAVGERSWVERAEHDNAIVYFAVEHEGRTIGQIMLHDAEWTLDRAMVGYHLFLPEHRGRGYGTAALQALVSYADGRALSELILITSVDNTASRRIAIKAGFKEAGPAREGPHLVVYKRGPLSSADVRALA